jgi:hypothetical protein
MIKNTMISAAVSRLRAINLGNFSPAFTEYKAKIVSQFSEVFTKQAMIIMNRPQNIPPGSGMKSVDAIATSIITVPTIGIVIKTTRFTVFFAIAFVEWRTLGSVYRFIQNLSINRSHRHSSADASAISVYRRASKTRL